MRTPLDKNDRIVCAINPALINEVPWGKFDIIRPLKNQSKLTPLYASRLCYKSDQHIDGCIRSDTDSPFLVVIDLNYAQGKGLRHSFL